MSRIEYQVCDVCGGLIYRSPGGWRHVGTKFIEAHKAEPVKLMQIKAVIK